MEENQSSQARKQELRTVSFFVAVIVALMGFSAALADRPAQPAAVAEAMAGTMAEAEIAPIEAPASHIVGATLAEDAVRDVEVHMYY